MFLCLKCMAILCEGRRACCSLTASDLGHLEVIELHSMEFGSGSHSVLTAGWRLGRINSAAHPAAEVLGEHGHIKGSRKELAQ